MQNAIQLQLAFGQAVLHTYEYEAKLSLPRISWLLVGYVMKHRQDTDLTLTAHVGEY